MHHPKERIMKVIIRAVLICLLFYITIACAGYFSTYGKTNQIVLDRPSLNGKVDYLILIAVGAIILELCVTIPLNYNPFRNQFFY